MNKEANQKWSKDQIETLIDAFKEEHCLYASDLPIYHNKHFREEAMNRVWKKVLKLRPNTTKEECQKKWKNMRNQCNIENAKVKASLKSGTGTDDIYVPNLWYYSLLLFLDTYVTPRKSRNSLEKHVPNPVSQNSGAAIYLSESQILAEENALDEQCLCTEASTSSALPTCYDEDSSNLSVCDNIESPNCNTQKIDSTQKRSKKRKRQDSKEEDFCGAINNLIESLKQPVVINNSNVGDASVNAFTTFIGTILQ